MTNEAIGAAGVCMLLWGVHSVVSTFAVSACRYVEPSFAVILPAKGDENLDQFLRLRRP
jgi:hypothetical protein